MKKNKKKIPKIIIKTVIFFIQSLFFPVTGFQFFPVNQNLQKLRFFPVLIGLQFFSGSGSLISGYIGYIEVLHFFLARSHL